MLTRLVSIQPDEELVQKLQEELQVEFIKVLNKADFRKILKKYGVKQLNCVTAELNLDTANLCIKADKTEDLDNTRTGIVSSSFDDDTGDECPANPVPSTCVCGKSFFNCQTGRWELCPCP